MKPKIDKTKFGSITVAGEEYEHDILIRLNGMVVKRKKKPSKEVFGTSHMISLAEAEYIYEEGTVRILIGTGQSGMVQLSEEAAAFFRKKCAYWNCCPRRRLSAAGTRQTIHWSGCSM